MASAGPCMARHLARGWGSPKFIIRCSLFLLAGQGRAVSLRLLFKLSQVDNTIPLCSPPVTMPRPFLHPRQASPAGSSLGHFQTNPLPRKPLFLVQRCSGYDLVTTNTGEKVPGGLLSGDLSECSLRTPKQHPLPEARRARQLRASQARSSCPQRGGARTGAAKVLDGPKGDTAPSSVPTTHTLTCPLSPTL